MKRFRNILLVVDPALQDEDVLQRALVLAENNQARLTVVSVIESIPDDVGLDRYGLEPGKLQEARIEARLQHLAGLLGPVSEKIELSTKVLVGTPFLEIIRDVLRFERDLVIKATEGDGGLVSRLFGSADMHLLRKCPCPVWLMTRNVSGPYKRILAAVDFDAPGDRGQKDTLNRQILEMATSLALSEFCELHVVHVWRAFGESEFRSGFARMPDARLKAYLDEVRQKHQRLMDGLMDDLAGWIGQEAFDYAGAQVHLLKGKPEDDIPRLADELRVDLIVMGTVARAGIPGFIMGNTAETILNRLHCSVLAVKPAGFVTPIR